MPLTLHPITPADIPSFHACLDAVAREQRFLALLEAPPLEHMQGFVSDNIARGIPHVVVRDGDQVVGWCDLIPGWHHTLRHCASLGMGLLPTYRGRGLGEALFKACLARAADAGITRIELEARADNEAALRLYRRLGFQVEGTKPRGMRVEGIYYDTIAMGLLL
ncbi:GNAT family N-acetyltransferase [Inhella gelatinilytica]|uniref:GNAT family N-acetyltransferase n=1 Tax=Inhella gelatinilytica TaxID=2795030 RepID=A0A931NCE8_9BURK|nr:GNAT family N-acetyltransferase [Inhella gelatinilytica]MBH9551927.1 GNAT family N-acetyltransferase [Inhella gelatinilytica]